MPRRIPHRLQWSTSRQVYAVFHDGKPVMPAIEPSSPHWFAWLETIPSFSFQSRSGESCTVRKETVQRGGAYWYAYRRRDGRMMKRYLARSTELTLAHLEAVATALNDAGGFSGPDLLTDEEMNVLSYTKATSEEVGFHSTVEDGTSSQLLLTTRLHPPRLPGQYVSRPRLLALLQQGMQGQLTLVSAPAGSGKTTLLAEWAIRSDFPVAWISLETADNDPLRFLSYLVAALACLDERIDAAHQPLDIHNPERALTAILNDLNLLLQQEAVVILDDYHVLTSDAVHALLRFLLDHLPPHLHLAVGTRVDPPLPLARLRAQRQLSEIRVEELRFVSDEVEVLASTMGLTLSHEATDLLEQHTEGWIAGIQLLALGLAWSDRCLGIPANISRHPSLSP